MKLRNGYQCDDGRWFTKDQHAQAKSHQAWLQLVGLCEMMVGAAMDDMGDEVIGTGHLAAEMRDCGPSIINILRANPIEGGGEEEATK